MKIAYFSDFFYPQIGGIQDSFGALGAELGRRGHEIYFYVPYYSKKHYEISNLPLADPDFGPNVHVVRLPSLPGVESVNRSRGALPGFFPWHRFKQKHFNVIHTQSFWMLGWESVIASKLFRVPLIGTNHLAAAHFVPLGKFYFKYLNWFYNRCDYVTAPSKWSFRAEMLPYGFKRPYRAISNPIDISGFHLASVTKGLLKEKFGLSKQVVVFGGRLAPEKKIDVMIRAIPILKEIFPEINLALAGRGAEENKLRDLAVALNVKKEVVFLGNLDKKWLAELFHASEVFALTSTSETQNMVMLQAMACGLPVVAVNAQALPEYVAADRGFVVEPGNPQALAEKIAILLKDRKKAKTLGLTGRKYVEQFSVANIATEWERIYNQVIRNYGHKE